jgi:hypothetical protein
MPTRLAILFFGLCCLIPSTARAQSFAERDANCIRKHPTWSLDDCERIAKGQTWSDMTDDQRDAAQQSIAEIRGTASRAKKKPKAATLPIAAKSAAAEPESNAALGFEVLLVFLLGVFVYLAPGIIASNRHHHQSGAIWALNIVAGWTFLGWVVALVWAYTAPSGDASTS